jgi:hypothetical protein
MADGRRSHMRAATACADDERIYSAIYVPIIRFVTISSA